MRSMAARYWTAAFRVVGLVLVLGGFWSGPYATPASAMPIYDFAPLFRGLHESWQPNRSFSPDGGPYYPAIFQNQAAKQKVFTLEPAHDSARPAVESETFYQNLNNRDLLQSETKWRNPEEPSDLDTALELESFTREATANSFTRSAARLDKELGMETPDPEAQPVVIRPAARAQGNEDVPLLSAMQLGTMALEVMGPELKQVEVFGYSLSEINELRKYTLISEPVTGNLMMMDVQPHRALMVSNTIGENQLLPLSTPRQGDENKNVLPSFMEDRTLSQKIIDFVTSEIAIVIYGIAILIWMTWRYFLRKYI